MLSPTHLVMSISRRAPSLGGHAPTPGLGRCPHVEYKQAHQVTAFLQGKRKRPLSILEATACPALTTCFCYGRITL